MQYNVAQLLKDPIGSSRSYRVEGTFPDSTQITDKVAGQVKMLRTHRGVLVTADLAIQYSLDCGRCLSGFRRPSWLHIEEEFLPSIDLHTGRRLPLSPEDEGALRIDFDHTLDLTEVMRQYAIADMPMKPLCRPDCLGLCRICGANLNQGTCGCENPPGDPRWANLARLLTQDNL